MAKLVGKSVGDKITEFFGPITGKNYNTSGEATPASPSVFIQVFGTGSVQVQQTQSFFMKANNGTNPYTWEREGTSWTNLGTPISSANGLVELTPTADTNFAAIRVIVSGTGEGTVVIQADW